MGFFGSSPSPPPIAPPPPIPTVEDPSVKEAEQRERERIRKARGRKATILTSGQGVLEEATVGRKTLLGA